MGYAVSSFHIILPKPERVSAERMRPQNTTTVAAATTTTTVKDAAFHHWNSPIPYLFGGLGLMLGLIALALVILAWSFRRSSAANSSGHGGEKPAKEVGKQQPDMAPRFVVIMPGDDNPKYLAKPTAPDRLITDQV